MGTIDQAKTVPVYATKLGALYQGQPVYWIDTTQAGLVALLDSEYQIHAFDLDDPFAKASCEKWLTNNATQVA